MLLAFSMVCPAAESEEAPAETLLGDEGDGSLAQPVHRIPLITDEGDPVAPDDEPVMAFSTTQSCGACHTYGAISGGWHFNAIDPNADAGRPGQPWIYVDLATATQIPLSYRNWPGTFKPEQIGMSTWEFSKRFAKHLPGGGVGDVEPDDIDEMGRQIVSGKMEINCLGCHNRGPMQDQAEYAMQMAKQNFRWGPAAGSGLAAVSGNAGKMPDTFDVLMPDIVTDPKLIPQVPTIAYRDGVFDEKGNVFFDIVRKVPNERCYYCHSNINVTEYGNEKWEADEDIHLTGGMTCVDCHRNGLDHNIIRGSEGEGAGHLAAASSCEGCHLGGHDGGVPADGRLGAPTPEHIGLPTVHFEKLACTACHSGPWPGETTSHVKNSQTHSLGIRGSNKAADALPHVEYPVLAKRADGKLAPHKLMWPAFWGTMKDGEVTPLDVEMVKDTVGDSLKGSKYSPVGSWPEFADANMIDALGKLGEEVEGQAVYVCGGQVFSVEGDKLVGKEHAAAEPYLWPIGHNVRPAAQSLGIRYCTDCHSTGEGFFFGKVTVGGPLAAVQGKTVEITKFAQVDPTFTKLFAMSFVFRPMMKIVSLAACGVIALVLLLFALKALGVVVAAIVGKD